MKVIFDHLFIQNGKQTNLGQKTIGLPFGSVSARAIVIRQTDGRILGMRHHQGAKFALPGGAVDDGETPDQAVIRELEEENVQLIGLHADWETKFSIDHYLEYRELSFWYVLAVKDATFGENDEVIETRWIEPQYDLWYPLMRAKIVLTLQQYQPDLATFYG